MPPGMMSTPPNKPSPLGLPPRHSTPMEADTPPTVTKPTPKSSPPTPNLLVSQVLGKQSTREVLHALHDLTHFGLCELEMLLQQFTRRSNGTHTINKATFVEEMGHAFGLADEELMGHIFDACDEEGEDKINFRHFAHCLSTVFRGTWEETMEFWFRMYDSDRDGQLTRAEFNELIQDISSHVVQQQVEDSVKELELFGLTTTEEEMISFDDFQMVMEEHHILPSFATPHQKSDDSQIEAYRDLHAPERELLGMLGVEMRLRMGEAFMEEGSSSTHFFFVVEGEVSLLRNNILLAVCGNGTFVGETAVFNDLASSTAEPGSDGAAKKFTTTAKAASPELLIVRLDIRDFLPLVYHQHQGATTIMQRLGEAVMQRVSQMEDQLQGLLSEQQADGAQLSRADWNIMRKRMLHIWALRYHRIGRKGKLEISATKNVGSAADLSIAYSPGVAEPCIEIKERPEAVYNYTAKGQLVGVVTNGTAVLGLGNIGPLAAKPVMEGKAVLFKKFADIDAFDIELDAPDPIKMVEHVHAMEPTFGGINLEDIKAPECFYVEKECQRRMKIPVFHDDQHGTAIIAGAGLINALELVNKQAADVRVVVCGCGAAGFTCALHFIELGVLKHNLICVDLLGVVYEGREDLVRDPENYLNRVAVDTPLRTLQEAVHGADVFLGLSAGGLMKPAMLLTMARDPLVFALANPVPEIDPEVAHNTRHDVIMATGRSDFPNQINNVCAFPYIFRGALDCRARCVNEEMKLAATHAIARMAKQLQPVKVSLSRSSSWASLMDMEHREQNGVSSKSSSRLGSARSKSPGRKSPRSRSRDLRNRPLRPSSTNDLGGGEDGEEGQACVFGRDYIIPKPFDERLLVEVSSAVAAAAIDSGVAGITLDMVEYRDHLSDMMAIKAGHDRSQDKAS